MANQHFSLGDFSIDTEISCLGTPKVSSPLSFASLNDKDTIPLYIDSEHIEELQGHPPVSLDFEAAGPRKNIYFDPKKSRCAIVTCGGLCPGLNDVIRAIVMEAHYKYKIPSVLGIRYGLEGFIPSYGHPVMELTPEVVSPIYQFGGSILGSSRGPQDPSQIVDSLERLNISVLFMIGGDGTLKAMNKIVKEVKSRGLHISIIGIPKTIDNDINFISKSFGFETAVLKASEAIGCAHIEAVGYKNGIGVVKLMGRDSGFIAAQATLALKEVNFVLIPEAPFTLKGEGGLLQQLERRLLEKKHAVIVLAEGAGQHLIDRPEETDVSGNRKLVDITELLRSEIKEYLESKGIPFALKVIDPSYMIRSIPANANDRVYCGFLGENAVHAAMAGKTNMVVAKIMDRYVHLPLELIIRKRRQLNINSDYWRYVLESTGQTDILSSTKK